MITKSQWKELCQKIREKRNEGKVIYFGKYSHHKVQACFQYRDFILLADFNDTKIKHKDFINQSYEKVKSQFFWTEVHDFNDKEIEG